MKRKRKLTIPKGVDEVIAMDVYGRHLLVALDERHGARVQGHGLNYREAALVLHTLADDLERKGVENGDEEPAIDRAELRLMLGKGLVETDTL